MKGATPEMEAEWSDEFAQCFVVAFMWADDQREAAAAVVREFIDGGKPVFSTPLRGKRLGWAKWSSLRMLVLERDGYECAYCGAVDDLCADHVVPLSRGGSNDESNLVCACRSCNSSKSNQLLAEWRGRS